MNKGLGAGKDDLAAEKRAVVLGIEAGHHRARIVRQLSGSGIVPGRKDIACQRLLKDPLVRRRKGGKISGLAAVKGFGKGLHPAPLAEIQTKRLDMQVDINLRAIVIFYRECLELLRAAGAEHRNALVVNTASIAGKHGAAWTSVYSATKHGVVGWTRSMHIELGQLGIKSTALCPAFVDTPMTDYVKEQVKAEDMIRPEDIAEAVRYLLRVSPACIVPEMMFLRPGDTL